MMLNRTIRVLGVLFAGLFVCVPAFGQIDFTGEWAPRFHEDQPERVGGPDLGDFLGVPINDATRMRGDSYDADILELHEWQCRPHSADYMYRGPSQLRISKEVDPVTRQLTAWNAEFFRSNLLRPIYLDGRPHPPEYALHTWAGYSTAKWQGNVLTITTTHLKEGYTRRNGLARSDKATVTEHWIRNGDYLTIVVIIYDPVYMTEPFVRTANYQLDRSQQMGVYPCAPSQTLHLEKGEVPHFLPGENPYLTEFANRYEIPPEAARGGAETMYPEYQIRLSGKTDQ
jgi:hypothetical protein